MGAVPISAGAPRPPDWSAEEPLPKQDCGALAHWIYHERRASLIVKRDGEVVWINAAGKALLAKQGAIVLEQGWLKGATQQISERLQALLTAPVETAPYWLLEEDGVLVWAEHIGAPARGAVGITIRPTRDEPDISALAEARQLTPAQARIVGMMLSGAETGHIARALEISVETLRTHVKHVYSKLGVKSRGAMFALAFRFAQP